MSTVELNAPRSLDASPLKATRAPLTTVDAVWWKFLRGKLPDEARLSLDLLPAGGRSYAAGSGRWPGLARAASIAGRLRSCVKWRSDPAA